MKATEFRRKRVLLVASAGGHWIQMRRLESAFAYCECFYIATESSYRSLVPEGHFFAVSEASRWNKFKLIIQAIKILCVLLWVRPSVVLSTGAAPGFFALFFAKFLGIKTIWVDSIANVEHMSLSGEKVKPYADLWLTQWQHLAREDGPFYFGSVL